MNTRIKFLLREKQIKNNCYPIDVRITRNRKSSYFYTNERVLKENWNDEFELCQNDFQGKKRIDNKLTHIKNKLLEIIDTLDKQGYYEATDVKNEFLNKKPETPTFNDFFKQVLENNKHKVAYGTNENKQHIYRKIMIFLNNKPIQLNDITEDFLNRYEKFCIARENKPNSIKREMVEIKAVILKAIDKGYISAKDNPFKYYKMPSQETSPTYLTEEELTKFKNVYVNPKHPKFHAKNIFLFGCYTGLRISDILKLKWKDITAKKIDIVIKKTKTRLNVSICDNAIKILDKYKNEDSIDSFVFPLLKRKRYDLTTEAGLFDALISSCNNCNRLIKKIGKDAGINKNLHPHVSRHTFATLALSKRTSLLHVKALLGHKDIKSTMIYSSIIDETLDNEVRNLNF